MSEKSNSLNIINSAYLSQNSNINQEDKASSKDFYKISKKKSLKKMIAFKSIHNLDLVTYDYIFMNRQILNSTIQDFISFKRLVEDLEKQFRPEMLNSSNIKDFKEQGKFSFNRYNITNLISPSGNNNKNIELSINSKYVHCLNIKFKEGIFYLSKSIFKGKHCFELKVLEMNWDEISFGLLNINNIETVQNKFDKLIDDKFDSNNCDYISNYEYLKIKSPISIHKINNFYHHYITYGDIFGICIDLDNKLLYLFLNGEIINTYSLNIKIGENISFVPFISLGKLTEIIFNPGDKLKFGEIYKKIGFIPLDASDKSNYETSRLKKVTDDYLKILINDTKWIINNKNITYSDINQIYYSIFNFLGNVSFQHSYIIQKCLLNNIELNYTNEEDLELYYTCIRYILNSVKDEISLLKNIILNLIESIHINLITGNLSFKKFYELFIYLLSKKDIVDIISKFHPNIIKHIFSKVFNHFHPYEDFFNKIKYNFIIKTDQNSEDENNNHNNIDIIFKDLKTDSKLFTNYLFKAQNFYNELNISTIFSKLVEIILKNGIESNQNENMYQNIIIKSLNNFLKSEKNELTKKNLCYCVKGRRFNNLLKSFFIPGMLLFNNSYKENKEKGKNLLTFSLKKYLEENNEEKLGGTKKYMEEQIIGDIPNLDEIVKMKINSVSNVFLNEFLDFFFIDKHAFSMWSVLVYINYVYGKYSQKAFIDCTTKNCYDSIYALFYNFIDYKLYFPSLEEIEIMVNFFYNLSDFFLNELYPKKIIYLLPEDIFLRFHELIVFLYDVSQRLSHQNEDIFDVLLNIYIFNDNKEKVEIINRKKNIIILCNKSLKQYISVLTKIIDDKKIKNIDIKCEILGTLKRVLIEEVENISDNEIFCIFNFISEIHNDPGNHQFISNIMKIFNNTIIKSNRLTKLGQRLQNLLKDKENNNLLRKILIILYDNINSSLSKLEEIFAEYKFKGNNNIQNTAQINNNNIEDINGINENHNNELPEINNRRNRSMDLIILLMDYFQNQRNIISLLTDEEKLKILDNYLKDVGFQFLKLINFYKLSQNMYELYDFNSFENKYLDNLLISLYDIIFSPSNSSKITDNKVMNSYITLINIILEFYCNMFKNITSINKENIMKELSRRRNIYHLKEIGQCFNKLKDRNNNVKNNFCNYLKNFNDFVKYLDSLVSENETKKLISNVNSPRNSGIQSKDKNLCPICSDSVIDTHILPCEHSICRNCLLRMISGNKVCPFCRTEIKGIKEDTNFHI